MDLQLFEFDAIETVTYTDGLQVTLMQCYVLKNRKQSHRLPFLLTVRELDGNISGELSFSYNGDTRVHSIDSASDENELFEIAHEVVRGYINSGSVALK